MPTTKICGGYCNQRYRDAEARRELHGDPNPIAPVYGRPWCETCTMRLHSTIRGMPDLAARLAVEATHGTPPAPEHVSGSKERHLHAGDGAYRLIDEICDTLTVLEDTYRYAAGFTDRDTTVRQGVAITRAARFLGHHLERVLDVLGPDAATHDSALYTLKRRCDHALQLNDPRPDPRPGVKCRECQYMALEREVDRLGRATGDTACLNCRSVFTEDEMQAWIRLCAAYARQELAA